jgi:hypothetical protein
MVLPLSFSGLFLLSSFLGLERREGKKKKKER